MKAAKTDRLSEQLREKLEESVATGMFKPGARLDEIELAGVYGVSRTPIREALFALDAAGLIVKRPGKGWEVAGISPARLCEMFDVMAELEAMSAELAARRATPDDLLRIEKAHEDCRAAKESGDVAVYYRCNEIFHRTIYDASHNSFLIEYASALYKRLSPYRRLQMRVRNRIPASFQEHQGVVDAILAGDGPLAAERLRQHVKVQGERFTDMVSSLAEMSAS